MTIMVKGVRRLARQYDPKLLRLALKSQLQKTTTTAIKEASQAVREVYNIKARDVKSHLKVKKPTVQDLEVVISMSSRPIPLYAFAARRRIVRKVPKNSRTGRKRKYYGATAKVLKKGPRKLYKGAFIGTINGHPQMLQRVGESRYPIRVMRAITPTTMFRKYGVRKIEEVFDRVFMERVMKEYAWRIERESGRV